MTDTYTTHSDERLMEAFVIKPEGLPLVGSQFFELRPGDTGIRPGVINTEPRSKFNVEYEGVVYSTLSIERDPLVRTMLPASLSSSNGTRLMQLELIMTLILKTMDEKHLAVICDGLGLQVSANH